MDVRLHLKQLIAHAFVGVDRVLLGPQYGQDGFANRRLDRFTVDGFGIGGASDLEKGWHDVGDVQKTVVPRPLAGPVSRHLDD